MNSFREVPVELGLRADILRRIAHGLPELPHEVDVLHHPRALAALSAGVPTRDKFPATIPGLGRRASEDARGPSGPLRRLCSLASSRLGFCSRGAG
eukprot:scaffold358_cov256-Pinguiococcus_pyrenoidosus.AAC.35